MALAADDAREVAAAFVRRPSRKLAPARDCPVDLLGRYLPFAGDQAFWAGRLARLGVAPDDERGMTTTEVAVITFLRVGAAIVVLGIIYSAAKGNADNIPTPDQPGG